jgi:zinc transporter ZupT
VNLFIYIVQSPTTKRVDKSLLTASIILDRTQHKKSEVQDRDCIANFTLRKTSSFKIHSGEKLGEPLESNKVADISVPVEPHHHEDSDEHHFNPKSNVTPYILLIALSIHGLFEGTALGVQKDLKDAVFLGVAILAHKWAESFTLGISFFKSNTERATIFRMIILFSIFTPVGILIGMFLIGADPLTQGIFLAISSGTFLYISASEVIVEEFAITKYKYQKYFLYLCGGLLVGILSFMEVQNED